MYMMANALLRPEYIVDSSSLFLQTVKPRLHDTTYCQTRLTTGCIVYTNIQPVVKPVTGCIV